MEKPNTLIRALELYKTGMNGLKETATIIRADFDTDESWDEFETYRGNLLLDREASAIREACGKTPHPA